MDLLISLPETISKAQSTMTCSKLSCRSAELGHAFILPLKTSRHRFWTALVILEFESIKTLRLRLDSRISQMLLHCRLCLNIVLYFLNTYPSFHRHRQLSFSIHKSYKYLFNDYINCLHKRAILAMWFCLPFNAILKLKMKRTVQTIRLASSLRIKYLPYTSQTTNN